MSNLALNLSASAERHPDGVAVRLDDLALSFADLDGATAHLAGLLREKGVQPGDAVAIALPNIPPFAICY